MLEEHLARWGLGVDEAWLLARRNVELLPRGTRSRQYGCWVEIDPSMFQHSRALLPATVEPSAPHGWILGAPMRSEIVVSPVRPGFDAGIDAVTRAVLITRRRWAEGGDPVCRHAWYVPSEGPGRWGEDAEPILIVDRSDVGRSRAAVLADPQVDIGERLHAVFGDRRPERPPPRLVI